MYKKCTVYNATKNYTRVRRNLLKMRRVIIRLQVACFDKFHIRNSVMEQTELYLINLQNKYILQSRSAVREQIMQFFLFLLSTAHNDSPRLPTVPSTLTVVLLIVYLKSCATTCRFCRSFNEF